MENKLYSEYLKTIEDIGNILSEDSNELILPNDSDEFLLPDEMDELELPS